MSDDEELPKVSVGGLDLSNLSKPEKMAIIAADGGWGHASTSLTFLQGAWGEIDLPLFCAQLDKQRENVKQGNLSHYEGMLAGQANSLDAMFHEFSRRSAKNASNDMEVMDRYMRLALKAQAQCRTTIEALSEIKNPRQVAFVRQANIAQNQQVNNETSTPRARARKPKKQQNELIGICHEQALDTRSPQASGRSDQVLEAVAAVDRPAQRRRQTKGQS